MISNLLILILMTALAVFIIYCVAAMQHQPICPNLDNCDSCPFPECSESEKRYMRKEGNKIEILDYLEYSYTGARMNDDIEMQTRISRAIVAFKADTSIDIFDKDFIENNLVDE